jgi:hypothetical protein
MGGELRINEPKVSLKNENRRKQVNGKFNTVGSIDENKEKISLQQICPSAEVEILLLLRPAQASLGYFLAWFLSLQLPSTQSESSLTLIPFTTKSHQYFRVYTQL